MNTTHSVRGNDGSSSTPAQQPPRNVVPPYTPGGLPHNPQSNPPSVPPAARQQLWSPPNEAPGAGPSSATPQFVTAEQFHNFQTEMRDNLLMMQTLLGRAIERMSSQDPQPQLHQMLSPRVQPRMQLPQSHPPPLVGPHAVPLHIPQAPQRSRAQHIQSHEEVSSSYRPSPPHEDPVLKALRLLNERLDRISEAKNRDNPLNALSRSPFAPSVQNSPLPRNFRLPKLEPFDGSSDPRDHVSHYSDVMGLYGYNDSILCKAFPTTLHKTAQDWFNGLPPGTISSFRGLSDIFVRQFVATTRKKTSSMQLMTLRQNEGETLRDFVGRFIKSMIEVRNVTLEIALAAMTAGCRNDQLVNSLGRKEPASIQELMERVNRYITAEELLAIRDDNLDR